MSIIKMFIGKRYMLPNKTNFHCSIYYLSVKLNYENTYNKLMQSSTNLREYLSLSRPIAKQLCHLETLYIVLIIENYYYMETNFLQTGQEKSITYYIVEVILYI